MTIGGKEFFANSQRYLERRIQLECDGELVKLPQRLQGVVFLNIPSYMAGTNFWGTEREKDVSMIRILKNFLPFIANWKEMGEGWCFFFFVFFCFFWGWGGGGGGVGWEGEKGSGTKGVKGGRNREKEEKAKEEGMRLGRN